MSKFEYEKKKIISSLKNEIFGINQLLAIFKALNIADYSKLNGKIINVKIEKALKEITGAYVSLGYNYNNDNVFSVIVYERYNQDTKSYIQFYDKRTLILGYDKVISVSGKESRRFNAFKMLENVENAIESLTETLDELRSELTNINTICDEYLEVYEKVREFKKGRTTFFLDNFKDLNGFY